MIITLTFTVLNVINIPLGYSFHIVRLLTSIMREPTFSKMVMRLILSVQFAFYGIIYFAVTVIVDMFVFFYNLYTEASKDLLNDKRTKIFSREGLQLFEESLDEILVDLEQKKTKMQKNHENLREIQSPQGGLLMD